MGNTVYGVPQAVFSTQRQLQTQGKAATSSLSQSFTQTIDSRMQFVTDEGDVVSLSSSLATTGLIETEQWNLPVGHGQEFTMASLQTGNQAISVEGDLSEEELADIARLVKDLSHIASTFFKGETGKALTAASGLGELGSLASLSATFLQTSETTVHYTSYHPVPPLDPAAFPEIEEAYNNFLSQAPETTPDYQELLQARWRQILATIEGPAEDAAPAGSASPAPLPEEDTPTASLPAAEASRQMVERIDETMTQHPRLSPFAAPLAMEALQKAVESSAEIRREAKELAHALQQLQHQLSKQLHHWLRSGVPGLRQSVAGATPAEA